MVNLIDWLIGRKIGCPHVQLTQLYVSSPVLVWEIVAHLGGQIFAQKHSISMSFRLSIAQFGNKLVSVTTDRSRQ